MKTLPVVIAMHVCFCYRCVRVAQVRPKFVKPAWLAQRAFGFAGRYTHHTGPCPYGSAPAPFAPAILLASNIRSRVNERSPEPQAAGAGAANGNAQARARPMGAYSLRTIRLEPEHVYSRSH